MLIKQTTLALFHGIIFIAIDNNEYRFDE